MTDRGGADAERWRALRLRAEAALREREGPGWVPPGVEADLRPLVHDLGVAQIELELQNEELRCAQEAIVRAQVRFEQLFDCAPVGYVVLDAIGMIQQANEAFCVLVRKSRDRVVGFSLRSFVSEDQRPEFDRSVRLLFRDGLTHAFDTKLGGDSGAEVRLSGSVAPMLVDGRHGVAYLVAVTDVSEAKRLDRQLREAQKLESVGRLAGGIAHDFNNVLMVIQGTIAVARMELGDEGAHAEYLDDIHAAAARASALVQQLLAFARRSPTAPRVVDLRPILTTAQVMLGRLVPESVTLSWEVDQDLHPVMVDPVQVDQVLTNLVLNARDALSGSGAVRVRAYNFVLHEPFSAHGLEAPPGRYAALEVCDDGAGMDEATLEHIFEPFFTTKAQGKGTGLGLSTVFGVVAQNHGLLHVESAPGAGTKVRVLLPRVEIRVDHGQDLVSPPSARGGTERVLLVEDDTQILSLARRLLARHGYEVHAVNAPEQALAWFANHQDWPDVVLTDVVMPGMSGPTMVEAMLDVRPELSFVFMSGYARDAFVGAHLGARQVVFVSKPFDAITLMQALRAALCG